MPGTMATFGRTPRRVGAPSTDAFRAQLSPTNTPPGAGETTTIRAATQLMKAATTKAKQCGGCSRAWRDGTGALSAGSSGAKLTYPMHFAKGWCDEELRRSKVHNAERIVLSGEISSKWKKVESILALDGRAIVTRFNGEPEEVLLLCERLA